jgi:hypothetical protein
MAHPRSTLACAVLAAAAALAVAGCASGDGDAADRPTRAQFIAGTDRVCATSNRRTRVLNRQLARAAAGARDDRDLLRRLAPILERGYGRVRDNAIAFRTAEPPAADAARIDRIRRLYDRQAEFVSKLAAAARRGDVRRFEALSDEQRQVVSRARRLARAFGFKVCGSTRSDPA